MSAMPTPPPGAAPSDVLLLMPPEIAEKVRYQLGELVELGVLQAVDTCDALATACATRPWSLLLSFGTGVIVPPEVLGMPGLCALNIHAASPDYPGRDPHHFAAYDGAARYGATLHYMTDRVDQGPIVEATWFEVRPGSTPRELLDQANAAGTRLAVQALRRFLTQGAPAKDPALCWSGPVRRRRDFEQLCLVDGSMSPEEFERRLRATAMPGYQNLRTLVHGRSFRLED